MTCVNTSYMNYANSRLHLCAWPGPMSCDPSFVLISPCVLAAVQQMAADYSNSISLAQERALHWLHTDTLRWCPNINNSNMLVSWWYLYLGAQSLYRQGKTDMCVCFSKSGCRNIVLNDLDWTREERHVRNRVCLSVYRTGRVCLSTSLEECPVSDLDL